jgi:hypothetical protein
VNPYTPAFDTVIRLDAALFAFKTNPLFALKLRADDAFEIVGEPENRYNPDDRISPVTSSEYAGDAVPIPSLLFVSFQKKLALSCAIVVPFENNTEPDVSDGASWRGRG